MAFQERESYEKDLMPEDVGRAQIDLLLDIRRLLVELCEAQCPPGTIDRLLEATRGQLIEDAHEPLEFVEEAPVDIEMAVEFIYERLKDQIPITDFTVGFGSKSITVYPMTKAAKAAAKALGSPQYGYTIEVTNVQKIQPAQGEG